MAISDTITSIEDNLRADYEGLENIGADLTGINKNILNIRTILDTIYNDMPKVTGEGTEVTLTPTRKGRLALIPKGNSTQESTTGKNLLAPFGNDTQANVTFSSNEYEITINGTSNAEKTIISSNTFTLPAGTYSLCKKYISGSINANIVFMLVAVGGSAITQQIYGTDTYQNDVKNTFTLAEEKEVRQQVYIGGANRTYSNFKFNMQIVSGSNADYDYEQYTGGIPAPNPSYPFPIKSVTR